MSSGENFFHNLYDLLFFSFYPSSCNFEVEENCSDGIHSSKERICWRRNGEKKGFSFVFFLSSTLKWTKNEVETSQEFNPNFFLLDSFSFERKMYFLENSRTRKRCRRWRKRKSASWRWKKDEIGWRTENRVEMEEKKKGKFNSKLSYCSVIPSMWKYHSIMFEWWMLHVLIMLFSSHSKEKKSTENIALRKNGGKQQPESECGIENEECV